MTKVSGVLLVIGIGLVTASVTWYLNTRKIAYVNIEKAFNEFQMKKELQKDLENTVSMDKAAIDQATLRLAELRSRWESDRQNTVLYDSLMNLWQRNEAIVEMHQVRVDEMTTEFDSRIQTQLRQYLSDFGRDKDLELLMGVINDGSVLYSTSSTDYTNDAIEYINEKYLDK